MTALIIEERHAGKPAREEALMASHAESIGVAVQRMTWKPFARRRAEPNPGDVVAGSVAFVRAALQSLKRQLPRPDPYPLDLAPWLHRRVWLGGKVGDALRVYLETVEPVFIKPAKRWKLFTGFVIEEPNPPQLYAVSRNEPVWCAEPVRFLSEWRAYVIHGELRFLGLSDHGGDRNKAPDVGVIHDAIAAYTDQPSAYAIDFGVLSTGETALIEANDGFAVGAYDDIPAHVYYEMTSTRWLELADTPQSVVTDL